MRSRSAAYRVSTYWENTRMPTAGWLRRIAIAARRPSSVWSGGIRTSTIATSGSWAATAASSASASPTAATISWPRSARISVRPALITAASSAMTMRMAAAFSGVGGQFDGDGRGAALRTAHLDAAVHGADPLGEAAQAAVRYRAGAADAVVGDADPQQAGDVHGFERSVQRAAVPGHVGEQFGGREVRDGLDRGRGPLGDVGDQLDGYRAAVRQRGERVGQAVVEHRRVDAAGHRPQVGDRLDHAVVRVLDQLGDAGQVHARALLKLLPGQAELHGQGHELRLGAVVQVPLDGAEPGGGVVHDARPAPLKRLD